jgi:hypothetical protein
MKRKARHGARHAYAAPLFLPPNLHAVGPLAFTDEDFAALDAWLAQPDWPAEHMDVAMLEGYLVALLVWPIELAPGAWLPRVWGIHGWKVAAKIAMSSAYNMTALHDNSTGLGSRSSAVRSAVENIARYASLRFGAASARTDCKALFPQGGFIASG